MIEIKWAWAKYLTDDERKFTIPLLDVATAVARLVRKRVSETGRTATGGTFTPYKRRSRGGGGRRFLFSGKLWRSLTVTARSPSRVVAQFKGSRLDRSQFRARKMRRQAKVAKLVKEGMNRAEAVKHVRNREIRTNAQLAMVLQREEKEAILAPSPAECEQASEIAAGLAIGQWLASAPKALGNFRSRRRDDKEKARVQRALAQLRALGVSPQGR